jgi:hypothetical protein
MSTSICFRASVYGRAERSRATPIQNRTTAREQRRGTDPESLGTANSEKPPRAGDRLVWTVTRRPSPITAWRRNRPRGSRIAERRPGETEWRNS